jgi:hypothetical protein
MSNSLEVDVMGYCYGSDGCMEWRYKLPSPVDIADVRPSAI